jgi:hypothetical protein
MAVLNGWREGMASSSDIHGLEEKWGCVTAKTTDKLRARQTSEWFSINSLRTDGEFCHKGWETEIAKKLKLLEPIDNTIHWITPEEHFPTD